MVYRFERLAIKEILEEWEVCRLDPLFIESSLDRTMAFVVSP